MKAKGKGIVRAALMLPVLAGSMLLQGCKENYSNGEKVGNLIEFTRKGVIYDSWEGRQVWGFKNVFYNRGETSYFIDDVTVLDKNFANPLKQMGSRQGQVIDTVFVVIDKQELLNRKK